MTKELAQANTLYSVQVVKNGARTEFVVKCDGLETVGNTLDEAVESMKMMINAKFSKLKEALEIIK